MMFLCFGWFQLGCNSNKTWEYSFFTKEDMEISCLQKKDANIKRDRMKKFSYSHRVTRWSYFLVVIFKQLFQNRKAHLIKTILYFKRWLFYFSRRDQINFVENSLIKKMVERNPGLKSSKMLEYVQPSKPRSWRKPYNQTQLTLLQMEEDNINWKMWSRGTQWIY